MAPWTIAYCLSVQGIFQARVLSGVGSAWVSCMADPLPAEPPGKPTDYVCQCEERNIKEGLRSASSKLGNEKSLKYL